MRGCSSCSVNDAIMPSAQGSVTNIYRARLSTSNELIIKLTWSKTRTGTTLYVKIDKEDITIHGLKGSCSCMLGNSVLGICYDFSSAKYDLDPEPISGFYLAVISGKEFALLVGDRSRDFVKRFGDGKSSVAEFCMVSRMVQVVGRAIYSTRARFYEEGKEHEIVIRFQGELEMSMHVDEKKVLHVRRLRWNFRGNDSFYIDGLIVDVMWDLFRWQFFNPSGSAVLLLRTRVSSKVSWWIEEEMKSDDGFSLLIHVAP